MDTCIVCLGELIVNDLSVKPVRTSRGQSPASIAGNSFITPTHPTIKFDTASLESIAHLLPCGHNLHNECLKPWVERANSCPICRQTFNQVELREFLHGPCVSSYAVQDRQQVADVDPLLAVDDDLFGESSSEPCLLCSQHGSDNLLLLCDGCSGLCHTFCVDLPGVPAGAWFCPFCIEDGTSSERSARRNPHRTRNEQYQARAHYGHFPNAWARVWQSVWDRLNIDLDFPFDETENDSTTEHNEAHRREFVQWRHRFHIAEQQGSAARFRDTATALLDVHPGPENKFSPPEESQEELRAWNAFEKAKELQHSSSFVINNKRKSPTASPTEPQLAPERKFKRPRTRRTPSSVNSNYTMSNVTTDVHDCPEAATSRAGLAAVNQNIDTNINPGFFQSLLKEVECTTDESNKRSRAERKPIVLRRNSAEYSKSGSSSATSSVSGQSSPCSRSLLSLSSSYSSSESLPNPISQLQAKKMRLKSTHSKKDGLAGLPEKKRGGRHFDSTSLNESQGSALSPQLSPSKTKVSFTVKAEIQEMVKKALKPAYRKREISTDQYTKINREVSRRIYTIVGESGGINNTNDKERWQTLAIIEVDSAVKQLRSSDVDALP